VSVLPHRLLLRPRENHDARIESSGLEIFPAHALQWKRDVLDNSVALVGFTEPSDRLRIAGRMVIQHYEDNPFDLLLDDAWAEVYPPGECNKTVRDRPRVSQMGLCSLPHRSRRGKGGAFGHGHPLSGCAGADP